MMFIVTRFLRRALAAACLVGLAPGAAHAGLVTGEWDPQFGSFLPGLSWQARASLLVPNACSAQADGIYTTASGPCQIVGNPFVSVWLRMFDTGFADPNNFFEANVGPIVHTANWNFMGSITSVSNVRVASGQVVGFTSNPGFAQTVVCVALCFTSPVLESWPSEAGGNVFRLDFDTDGPNLTCLACRTNINLPAGTVDVASTAADLTQFLVTYNDDPGATPKFTDTQGNALGARLNNVGEYLGQFTTPGGPVPEPGALLLAMTALAGIGLARRRKA